LTEGFNRAELLTTEALLAEIGRRTKIETSLLERLADAVTNRTYDVFLFLLKYGPATQKEIEAVFSRSTVIGALARLEGSAVIIKKDFKYRVRK